MKNLNVVNIGNGLGWGLEGVVIFVKLEVFKGFLFIVVNCYCIVLDSNMR